MLKRVCMQKKALSHGQIREPSNHPRFCSSLHPRPQRGGGVLGRLVQGILHAVGEDAHVVEVVSVHDAHRPPFPHESLANVTSAFFQTPPPSFVSPARSSSSSSDVPVPSACVWVSVKEALGSFIDPVKLQGLLQLHSAKVQKGMAKGRKVFEKALLGWETF